MCARKCIGMWADMRVGMCVQTNASRHVCRHMCVDMCVKMCVSICKDVDMGVDMCEPRHVCRHARGHARGQVRVRGGDVARLEQTDLKLAERCGGEAVRVVPNI